jgi:hypothetical protein
MDETLPTEEQLNEALNSVKETLEAEAPASTSEDNFVDQDSEDAESVQVALEIIATDVADQLQNDWQLTAIKPKTMSDAMRVVIELINTLATLDTKVLSVIAMMTWKRRPYKLSDPSWVYILKQVTARLESKRQNSRLQSVQGLLEPMLSSELKSKLRTVCANGWAFDGEGKLLGKAYRINEVVDFSPLYSMTTNIPELIKAALGRIADKLQALDEKYGIHGVQTHAFVLEASVVDLHKRFIVGILPVIGGSPTLEEALAVDLTPAPVNTGMVLRTEQALTKEAEAPIDEVVATTRGFFRKPKE